MTAPIEMTPIGHVFCERATPIDDGWDAIPAIVKLEDQDFVAEALAGLENFSHVEIIFFFHLVDTGAIVSGRRHPRGRTDWPRVGIFAQRGKARPNRLGATICQIVRIEGCDLHVMGLDAIDGTPVLDIKPIMGGFLPRGPVKEPAWAQELMAGYW